MKKTLLLAFSALAVLVSCEKKQVENAPVERGTVFDLSANHPDGAGTKAVKSDWEDGDKVFVVFSGAEAAHYLIMSYSAGVWTNSTMNEDVPEALSLAEGSTGTMTAIFLPFAKDETYLYENTDGSYEFSEVFHTYYLTATLPYTVSGGKVSGSFDMQIPAGYVQFFIDDAAAVDGKAMIWESKLKPCGVSGVGANGITLEFDEMDYGQAVTGFAYNGGYLFSGILAVSAQNNPVPYTFHRYMGTGYAQSATTAAKTMQATGSTGRAANITNLAWADVAAPEAVDLGLSSGTKWANINVGAAGPVDFGAYFAWAETSPKAFPWEDNYIWIGSTGTKVIKYCPTSRTSSWSGAGSPDNILTLEAADDAAKANWGSTWQTPTREQCSELRSECTWTWKTDYLSTGVSGYLIEGNGNSIFLPAAGYKTGAGTIENGSVHGYYWTNAIQSSSPIRACMFDFYSSMAGAANAYMDRFTGLTVRPVK